MFDHRFSHLTSAALSHRAEQYAHLLREAADGFPACPHQGGWADPRQSASETVLKSVEELAARIRREGELFILIGVGGSNNAARAVINALGSSGPDIVYAGNSTAPSAIEQVLRRMEGRSVFIHIIAKNFATLEPGAAFRVIRKKLYDTYGEDAARRVIATGTPGSSLHRLCQAHGWAFLPFPETVGGRYSALTEVGLLPMAAAGIDIRRLVEGAAAMRERLLSAPAGDNPALLYAAARSLLYEQGYRAEVLTFFEPRLRWFAKWWIQLFAESGGKGDRGLLPVACECSEELHAMGQFLQQGTPIALETFLRMEDEAGPALSPDGVDDGFGYLDQKDFSQLNRAAETGSLRAHSARLPCLQIMGGPCDEKTFGGLFYFFMLSCVFSCRMSGADPFDQPGVEAYKTSMFQALGKE